MGYEKSLLGPAGQALGAGTPLGPKLPRLCNGLTMPREPACACHAAPHPPPVAPLAEADLGPPLPPQAPAPATPAPLALLLGWLPLRLARPHGRPVPVLTQSSASWLPRPSPASLPVPHGYPRTQLCRPLKTCTPHTDPQARRPTRGPGLRPLLLHLPPSLQPCLVAAPTLTPASLPSPKPSSCLSSCSLSGPSGVTASGDWLEALRTHSELPLSAGPPQLICRAASAFATCPSARRPGPLLPRNRLLCLLFCCCPGTPSPGPAPLLGPGVGGARLRAPAGGSVWLGPGSTRQWSA